MEISAYFQVMEIVVWQCFDLAGFTYLGIMKTKKQAAIELNIERQIEASFEEYM